MISNSIPAESDYRQSLSVEYPLLGCEDGIASPSDEQRTSRLALPELSEDVLSNLSLSNLPQIFLLTLSQLFKEECTLNDVMCVNLDKFEAPLERLSPLKLLKNRKLLKLFVYSKKEYFAQIEQMLSSGQPFDPEHLEQLTQFKKIECLYIRYEAIVAQQYSNPQGKPLRIEAKIIIAKKYCKQRLYAPRAITITKKPCDYVLATGKTLYKIEQHAKLVGKGTSRYVYQVTNLENPSLKGVLLTKNPNSMTTPEMYNYDLLREKMFRSTLGEYAVPIECIYALGHSKDFFAISPCYNCDLWDYLYTHAIPYNEQIRRKFVLQLLMTLAAMQEKKTIHRDISLENLLIEGGGIILTDFESAVFSGENVSEIVRGVNDYQSPELPFHVQTPDYRHDVWPLGLIFCEFLFQNRSATISKLRAHYRCIKDQYEIGFEGISQTEWKTIHAANIHGILNTIPDDSPYKKLLQAMLTVDLAERPYAKDLLEKFSTVIY